MSSLSVEASILSFIETRLVFNHAEISISRIQEQVCFLSCLVKIQYQSDTSFMMRKAYVALFEVYFPEEFVPVCYISTNFYHYLTASVCLFTTYEI